MSVFSCPVVEIKGFGRHKNADTLCVTQVEGSTCIFKEGTYKKGDWAVFVPVDALVPLEHPAFSWLKDPQRPNKTHHRVKALRLRGVFSDGILVPIWDLMPLREAEVGDSASTSYTDKDGTLVITGYTFIDGFEVKLGQDVAERLGVTKAEDKAPAHMGGDQEYGPDVPVYDIEPLKKFHHVFEDDLNERVVVTDKIHGTNSRFVFTEGRLWVGSRNRFLRMDERNLWWKIAIDGGLEEKLRQIPDHVLYGETFGDVQDLTYGYGKGSGVRVFAAFDIYDIKGRRYLDYDEFKATCEKLDIPTVPVLYDGPYKSFEHMDGFVNPPEEDGKALMSALDSKTIREGAVIKTAVERWNNYTHRTILKHVSRAYLLRKNPTELH